MTRLHPYWRMQYIKAPKPVGGGSPFRTLWEGREDRQNLIVYRGITAFVLMNNAPYNPGHLMVLPNREVAELEALTAAEKTEILDVVIKAQSVLTKVMNPAGFNIGINLGKAAGAGIPSHLHFHIVPRWDGDQNFMPVIAETHLLPQALDELWLQLSQEFAKG